MKLTKNQTVAGATVIFGAIIFSMTIFYIVTAFSETDPVSAKLFGMFNGAMVAFWVFYYYWAMSGIAGDPADEEISAKVQDRVLRKALYIARTNKQIVRLENYPLVFFKRNGVYKADIHAGCSLAGKAPEVEFELRQDFNIDVMHNMWVTVISKRLPVELAPDWLKENPLYKKAVKDSISEIEKEIKENCKEGSLDKLKQAVKI